MASANYCAAAPPAATPLLLLLHSCCSSTPAAPSQLLVQQMLNPLGWPLLTSRAVFAARTVRALHRRSSWTRSRRRATNLLAPNTANPGLAEQKQMDDSAELERLRHALKGLVEEPHAAGAQQQQQTLLHAWALGLVQVRPGVDRNACTLCRTSSATSSSASSPSPARCACACGPPRRARLPLAACAPPAAPGGPRRRASKAPAACRTPGRWSRPWAAPSHCCWPRTCPPPSKMYSTRRRRQQGPQRQTQTPARRRPRRQHPLLLLLLRSPLSSSGAGACSRPGCTWCAADECLAPGRGRGEGRRSP